MAISHFQTLRPRLQETRVEFNAAIIQPYCLHEAISSRDSRVEISTQFSRGEIHLTSPSEVLQKENSIDDVTFIAIELI